VNNIAHFTIANVTYNCVQQYRQHREAQQFDDDVRVTQIMNATNPDEQRGFGSKVTHFNKITWGNRTKILMHEANFNEFVQNKNLKQELLTTIGTTIAQACPFKDD